MDRMEYGAILESLLKVGKEGANFFQAEEAVEYALNTYDEDAVFEAVAVCREIGQLRGLLSIRVNAFLDAVLYMAQKSDKHIVRKLSINPFMGFLCKAMEDDFRPYENVIGEALIAKKDRYKVEIELLDNGRYKIHE